MKNKIISLFSVLAITGLTGVGIAFNKQNLVQAKAEASNVLYENDFSTTQGYIDANNSWERNVKGWAFSGASKADASSHYTNNVNNVIIKDGELLMKHEPYKSNSGTNHYPATIVTLPDLSNTEGWTGNYIFEVDVRYTNYNVTWNSANVNNLANCGLGLIALHNPSTSGGVLAKYSFLSKAGTFGPLMVFGGRVGGVYGDLFYGQYTNLYGPSTTLSAPFDIEDNHTFSLKLDGMGTASPSISERMDDGEFITCTAAGVKNYFGNYGQGNRLAIQVGNCGVAISSVKVTSIDGLTTFYSYDFNEEHADSTFWDGWKTYNGNSVTYGDHMIKDGKLLLRSSHDGIDHAGEQRRLNAFAYNHVLLPESTPSGYSDLILDFDFTFKDVYDNSKYFALIFRGGEDDGVNTGKFTSVFFRNDGRIGVYAHESSLGPSWPAASSEPRTTAQSDFAINQTYHVRFLLNGNAVGVIVTGGDLVSPFVWTVDYSTSGESNPIQYTSGRLGFLTSSADVEFDNLRVTTLDGDAEAFAHTFLTTLTCDSTGVTPPSVEEWKNLAYAYEELDESTKLQLKNLNTFEPGSEVESAIVRYSYIITKYGTENYSNFLDLDLGSLPSHRIDKVTVDYSVNIAIAIGVLSTLGVAYTLFLLKRKHK